MIPNTLANSTLRPADLNRLLLFGAITRFNRMTRTGIDTLQDEEAVTPARLLLYIRLEYLTICLFRYPERAVFRLRLERAVDQMFAQMETDERAAHDEHFIKFYDLVRHAGAISIH